MVDLATFSKEAPFSLFLTYIFYSNKFFKFSKDCLAWSLTDSNKSPVVGLIPKDPEQKIMLLTPISTLVAFEKGPIATGVLLLLRGSIKVFCMNDFLLLFLNNKNCFNFIFDYKFFFYDNLNKLLTDFELEEDLRLEDI